MRGEWGSAASSFHKAVSRTPGNWAGWWMLGFAEEQRGNESAAVAAYKTSLRVDTSLFDVRKNPFAARTRLKGRVLLESLDARLYRQALPATEQMAEPDLVTSFQHGHVGVLAVPGAPVPAGAPAPGVPASEARVPRPGPAGPVVTSVPPVSASRPAPRPGSNVSAPVAAPPPVPTVTRAGEPIPSDFPEQSPAGPAPTRPVQPGPGTGDAPLRLRRRHPLCPARASVRDQAPFHFGTNSVGEPAPPEPEGTNLRSSPTASTARRSSDRRPSTRVSETVPAACPFSTQ